MTANIGNYSPNVVTWFSYCPPLAASGPAASVGTAGPLSLVEDELVYTMASGGEEDLIVTTLMETQGLTCRPTSIISFKSDCCSQAACVISAAEDGSVEDYHMTAGPATTSGVTDVAAIAEVSVTDSLRSFGMWKCVLNLS